MKLDTMFTATQHSVHPTGGTRRVFRQVSRLKAGSGKGAFPRPAHQRVKDILVRPKEEP
jgi:hypothetical protein